MRVGEVLQPVIAAMRKDLLSASYLQADETTVPVQMQDRRGSNHEAYLWQYGKPGGETVFDFCLGRGRDGPRKFLDQWEGILQTDGYQAYDGVGGPKMVHVGCWAHARRKFVDAIKVNPHDAEAMKMVVRMDALFLIDRNARQEGLTSAERLAFRREHAQPWVGEIRQECLAISRQGLPQSASSRAAAYTEHVAEAGALPGVRGSRVVQQSGGELHASGRTRKEELAARRECQSGPESCRDSLDRRILPAARRAGKGVPHRRAAGVTGPHTQPSCQPHSRPLVRRSWLATLGWSDAYTWPNRWHVGRMELHKGSAATDMGRYHPQTAQRYLSGGEAYWERIQPC